MSGYTPKEGDRVRVVIEGTVTQVHPNWFSVDQHDISPAHAAVRSVACLNLDSIADAVVPKYLPFVGSGRVHAVKELRAESGCTLHDAVRAVDRAAEAHGRAS
jgi:hypothetical protein